MPLCWTLHLGVQYIMVLCAAAILALEARLALRPDPPGYRLLLLSLGLSGVACDPENHWLQWHALGHVLSAWAMLPLVEFYRREVKTQSIFTIGMSNVNIGI